MVASPAKNKRSATVFAKTLRVLPYDSLKSGKLEFGSDWDIRRGYAVDGLEWCGFSVYFELVFSWCAYEWDSILILEDFGKARRNGFLILFILLIWLKEQWLNKKSRKCKMLFRLKWGTKWDIFTHLKRLNYQKLNFELGNI